VTDERGDATGAPPTNAATIKVRTKTDLAPATAGELGVSATTGVGLDDLRAAILHAVGTRGVALSAEVLALQPRHDRSLRHAVQHLDRAIHRLEPHEADHAIPQIELIAGDLRRSLDELAALGGQMTPDDVIGKVFATFCVGK
jgi:tRNA modification GTPase